MKLQQTPDFPLVRSEAQARILARLFLSDPSDSPSLTQLADEVGVSAATTYREIERLEKAGLVESRRVGNVRLIQPATGSPVYEEVKSLIEKTYGPVPVLQSVLASIDGISEAFIYGSWARRASGRPGPPPRDIDLAVVGRPNVDNVYAACSKGEERLGLDVNPTVLTEDEWLSGRSGFLESLRSGERVSVLPDRR